MPNNIVPIGQDSSLSDVIKSTNNAFSQLDAQTVTKTYRQSGGNAIVEGKLPYNNGYGTLHYNTSNIPNMLLGRAPDDSRPGLWIVKDGFNVLDELS